MANPAQGMPVLRWSGASRSWSPVEEGATEGLDGAQVGLYETLPASASAYALALHADRIARSWQRLTGGPYPAEALPALDDAVDRRAGDGLFVRLLDVGPALSARSYAADVDLVLELDDPFCPWNSGRHRLRDGRCERTDDPADLALGAEALGSIYLGGTPLAALAGAGRVRELRPGALHEAATAFQGAVTPWCPEIF